MINLAGNKDCDKHIREELYLADIETFPLETKGEVPYTIAGRLGDWTFRRAWYYWIASVETTSLGLPLASALELHNLPNPTCENDNLGFVVRAGGDAGSPSPDGYVAQPVYDETLNEKLLALGYEMKYSEIMKKEYIPITVGEIGELCKAGKLDVERYVNCYHIDTQIGLVEFAKFLNKFYLSKFKDADGTQLLSVHGSPLK